VYEDKNNSATIAYIQDNANSLFKSTDDLSKGFSDSAWWLKINIENPTAEQVDKHLIFEFPLLDNIEIYMINNENISVRKIGRSFLEFQNDVDVSLSKIDFTLQPHSKKTLFVKLKSDYIIHLQYKVLDTRDTFEYFTKWNITTTFLLTALSFLLIYNLINFIWFKKKIYLYYVLYTFGGIIAFLGSNNLSSYLFQLEIDNTKLYTFGGMIFYIGLAFFICELLKEKVSSFDIKLRNITVIVLSVLIVINLFDSAYTAKIFLYGVGLLITILLTWIIINAFIRQHPLAKYVILTWLILSFFISFFLLSMLGVVGVQYRYFYMYGQIIEGLIFSIIINYQHHFMYLQNKQEREAIKLAQMGELIAMIAHQWRQPLSSISAITSTLSLDITMDMYKKDFFSQRLEDINKLTQHLSSTINEFRNFFKPNKNSIETQLKDTVLKSLDLTEELFSKANIKITTEFNDNKSVTLYENEFIQVVLNILSNAHDNFIEKSIKNPSIKITTKDKAIFICDNGGGVSEDIINKVFEPYFSTKNEKNGMGLGLYMSKMIIEEHHNGKLSVYNKNDGACFKIIL